MRKNKVVKEGGCTRKDIPLPICLCGSDIDVLRGTLPVTGIQKDRATLQYWPREPVETLTDRSKDRLSRGLTGKCCKAKLKLSGCGVEKGKKAEDAEAADPQNWALQLEHSRAPIPSVIGSARIPPPQKLLHNGRHLFITARRYA